MCQQCSLLMVVLGLYIHILAKLFFKLTVTVYMHPMTNMANNAQWHHHCYQSQVCIFNGYRDIGQFDLDLLFQGHPDSNQFFIITCSLHLIIFKDDVIYCFDGIVPPKSIYTAPPLHPSIIQCMAVTFHVILMFLVNLFTDNNNRRLMKSDGQRKNLSWDKCISH